MGTELNARGIPTPLPGWSAHALETQPAMVQAVHRDYALAGASVHSSNTFRTHARQFPDTWRQLTERAIQLARAGLEGFDARLAGSMSPLEDCYRPELSPKRPQREHREMAQALHDFGVDQLLVETFSNPTEALVAVQAAVETGLPTWLALTPGPEANLLSVEELRRTSAAAVAIGAQAVLVNCVPAERVAEFLPGLQGLGVPFGAYANAGFADTEEGWTPRELSPAAYLELAALWRAQGATILGGCCGTGVEHIRSLQALGTERDS